MFRGTQSERCTLHVSRVDSAPYSFLKFLLNPQLGFGTLLSFSSYLSDQFFLSSGTANVPNFKQSLKQCFIPYIKLFQNTQREKTFPSYLSLNSLKINMLQSLRCMLPHFIGCKSLLPGILVFISIFVPIHMARG
jgi:hypothetical protein